MCAVTGAQYLTSNGWSDLRNPITNDYPFRMFRDEGRTFLQVSYTIHIYNTYYNIIILYKFV